MSNLKLNIPITFEAGAALQIKEDITQSVQNTKGMLTTFNQSATGFDMFLSYLDSTDEHYSGLSINQDKIILDAAYTYIQAPGGGRTEFFSTTDGKAKIKTDYITADNVTAKSLNTTSETSTININAGIINCISPSTGTRIEFGIDDNNNAVLKFIRNNVEIYNLGPDGLMCLNFETKQNEFTEVNYVKSTDGYYVYSNSSTSNHSTLSIANANSGMIYVPLIKISSLINRSLDDSLKVYAADITEYWNSRYSNYNVSGGDFTQSIFYESISTIFPGEQLLIIDLSKYDITDINSKFYLFTSGYKKIEDTGSIAYIDGNGNTVQTSPNYNGKTYKSNSEISINYLTNSSNYITDGYYINNLSSVDISSQNIIQLLYNGSTSHSIFNNMNFCAMKYKSRDSQTDINLMYEESSTNIKSFYINKFINGNNTKLQVYYLEGFISDSFVGTASGQSVYYATYVSQRDGYYTDFNGTGGYSQSIIEGVSNQYKRGILCNSTGEIFTVKSSSGTDISTYIDEYITWLNS